MTDASGWQEARLGGRSPLFVAAGVMLLLGACVRLPTESNAPPAAPEITVIHDPDYLAPLIVELRSRDPENKEVCFRALVNGRRVPEEPLWSTFVPSGEPLLMSLDLDLDGPYRVEFEARDAYDGVSPVSSPLDLRFSQQWILIDSRTWPLPSDRITALAVNGPTRLIGTEDAGLAIFVRQVGWDYIPPSMLPSGDPHVTSVWPYIWNDSVAPWVGTASGGVRAVLRGSPTMVTRGEYPLPDDRVTSVAIGRSRAWIGTWGGGVAGVDTTSWEWLAWNTQNSALPSNNVSCIAVGDGLWFGTDAGLAHRASGVWTVYSTSNSPLPSDHVTALALGPNASIWIGTDGGLAAIRDGTWSVFRRDSSPLPSDHISALVTDASSIWIGTEDAGLAHFGVSGWRRFNTTNSPIPSNRVTALAYATLGWPLWIGTDQGLANFSGYLAGAPLHGDRSVEDEVWRREMRR